LPSQRILRKVERRFGSKLAELFGADSTDFTFNVVKGLTRNSEDGRLAQAGVGTGVVDIDRRFLRTGTRADVRGALIHEMAHALGQGSETSADYARYVLNPKEAAYWKPSEAVLDMANETGVNGPRPERTTGRSRDTVVNNASKVAPPVSPASAVNLGDQLAQGTYAYLQQLALLKQQLAAAKVGKRDAFAEARAQRVAGMAGAVNTGLERGISGSSIDLGGRAAVVAEQAAAKQSALRAYQEQVSGVQMQQVDAAAQFAQLQASIANARAAERMAALQEQYYNGLYDPAADAKAERTGEKPRSRQGVSLQDWLGYRLQAGRM
jgi:hypothetical protein